MAKTCYLNQHFIPCSEAGINLSDLGLLRSYGVFDFFRTYNGHPFLLDDHLGHFRESAEILGIDLTFSDDHIRRVVKKLIDKNEWRDGGIRMVLTGGEESNFFIIPEELPVFSEQDYQKGVAVKTYSYQRPYPRAKTLNYLIPWTLRQKSFFKDITEIIYTDKGKILEGSQSNLFVIKEGNLITPKENVFHGATRNLVLELAAEDFNVEERDLLKEEVKEVEEVFITSTTKEILPVTKWNDREIGSGEVGPQTKKIRDLFRSYLKKSINN